MLVQNKEKRVLGPPAGGEGNEPVVLKPGINDVPDDVWARCRNSKFVKQRMDCDEPTLVEVGAAPDKGLAGMDMIRALEVVKGTLDLAMLHEWVEGEKRKKVKDAVQRQIALLEEGRHGDEE